MDGTDGKPAARKDDLTEDGGPIIQGPAPMDKLNC